jgi:hypothetical protein
LSKWKQWVARFQRSVKVVALPVGKHLFADSGPFDPAKQFLADFLDSRADVFLLCPLMSQKWTVR